VGAQPKHHHVFQYFRVERNLIRAHQQAYIAIKAERPEIMVSIVKHVRWFTADERPSNRIKARVMQYLQSDRYMRKIVGYLDEIGLNYYRVTKFGDRKNYLKTDMGWNAYPSGIFGALKTLKKFKKPIFISEAGLADDDDDLRAQYLYVQIYHVYRAIQDGVDVRGHMYWSLIDNYEWALGTQKCFGLVAINYQTLERTIRPSAWVYKEIIEENGLLE
jgi:beta-glucosidase